MMHSRLFVVLALSLISGAAAGQPSPSTTPADRFRYLTAKDEAGLLNKPGPAPAVSMLSDHEYYLSEIVRRTTDGQVEVHRHWIDFMTVLSGEAELTYGGTLSGGQENDAGERRGGTIAGGTTVMLHAGDYLEIPAGVPHLMTRPTNNFRYLVVKVRV